MDVVIPVAEEPRNDTLGYALASIARHAPELRVVLAGNSAMHVRQREDGSWPLHLPFEQAPGEPIRNTDGIMRAACLDPRISDPFVWSNDDIYWRRPVDFDELCEQSATATGMLPVRRLGATLKGIYTIAEAETERVLRALNRPTFSYERHVPLVVRKAEMLSALQAGTAKRSMYLNLYRSAPARVAADVKVWRKNTSLPDLALEPFFSTGNDYPIGTLPDVLGL